MALWLVDSGVLKRREERERERERERFSITVQGWWKKVEREEKRTPSR